MFYSSPFIIFIHFHYIMNKRIEAVMSNFHGVRNIS